MAKTRGDKAMDNPKNDPAIVELTLDFESLGVGELTDFLCAIRSVLVRLFIAHIREKGFASRPTTEWEHAFRRAHDTLSHSYLAHYSRLRPTVERRSIYLEDCFDEDVFNDWIATSLKSADLQIQSAKHGSLVIVLSLAALLTLVECNFDYSMVKDLTQYMLGKIRGAMPRSTPKDTVTYIPDIVRQLSGDPRVTRLQLTVAEDNVDLKVEWRK